MIPFAAIADVSTPALVVGGVLASVATVMTNLYSSYRTIKHEADTKDSTLVQGRLEMAMARIHLLEQEVAEWKALALSRQSPGPPDTT